MCRSNSYKATYRNSRVQINLITLQTDKSLKTTANVQFRKQQDEKTIRTIRT
jgi:hypothetical protein